MGRTNIVLDDRLVDEAMRITGAQSKREVVDLALRRIVDRDKLYRALRTLKGKTDWQGDIDRWRRTRG